MPITTEITDGGFHCVTWKTQLEMARNKTNEFFQLNHFPTYTSYFGVSYTYDPNNLYPPIRSRNEKYLVEICLTQSANKGLNSHKDSIDVPDYYREPCAVWIESNDGNKLMFEKISKGWTINNTFSKIWFVIKINIQFNTFSDISILLKQLTDIYVNQTNCDIQFCFENNDQKIGGHVCILAARSPVFAKMLYSTAQETKSDPVIINDVQPEIFKEMLHFIYSSGTRQPLTEDTAWSLVAAADKYDVPGLKKECSRVLLFYLEASNAINVLVLADRHSMKKVKEAAIKFIAVKFETFFPSYEWEDFAKNYPDLCVAIRKRMVKSSSTK